MDMRLHDYTAYLFDLDGTLWTGSELYAGASNLMQCLAEAGKRCVIVSNNSVLTGDRARAVLAERGLAGEPLAVTVTDVAGEYVARLLGADAGRGRVRVAGAPLLHRQCRLAGLETVDLWEPEQADVVLLGLHDSFTYQSLERLVACVEQGERFVVTNEDPWHPGPEGAKVPETGALLAGVRAICQCEYRAVGKPGRLLFDRALELAGVAASDAVMVGDSLDTDVAGARRAGIDSVWISFARPLPDCDDRSPTAVYESLSELAADLRAQSRGAGSATSRGRVASR